MVSSTWRRVTPGWVVYDRRGSYHILPYIYMGMDQYLLIPFLVGWTSIYQLFWCSPGVQGFDTLPYIYICIGNDNYPWNQAVFHGMMLRFFFYTAHLTNVLYSFGLGFFLGSDRKRWPSWTWTTQSKISIGRVATPTDMSGNPSRWLLDEIKWICDSSWSLTTRAMNWGPNPHTCSTKNAIWTGWTEHVQGNDVCLQIEVWFKP